MRARVTALLGRRGPEPSPSVRGELEQLDAALEGASGDTALDALVADLRACAPRMTPAFTARLDARAAAGFRTERATGIRRGSRPRPSASVGVAHGGERHAGGRPSPSGMGGRLIGVGLRGRLALGSGVLVTVVAALVMVALIGGPRHPATSSVSSAQSGAAPGSTRTSGAPSPAAGAASAPVAPALAPSEPPAAASGVRRQQVSASLSLSTGGSVQSVSDGVVRVTGAYGGYVQSSQVKDGTDGGQAYLVLVLPTGRLALALGELSRLAHVQSTNQATNDITDAYDSARRQLADDATQRQALLHALANATTQGQIDSLRGQVELVGGRIDRDRVALDSVNRQSRTSQVNVTIARSPASAPSAGWTIGNALSDAGTILKTMAAVALLTGTVTAPVLLSLATLLAAGRAVRRTRRERALDAPV